MDARIFEDNINLMSNAVTKNSSFVTLSGKGRRTWPLLFLFGVAASAVPSFAWASGTYEISSVLCDLTTRLISPTGKAMATLAIVATGVLALFGKSSWGTAIMVAGGIAMAFGAGTIVTAMGGSDACASIGSNPFTFSCNNGVPTGNLFDANQSLQQMSNPIDSVFASTLFFFKSTLGSVMSSLYCALAYQLQAPLMAAFTLFIIVFGLMVVSGIVNLTIRELAVVLFKISLIWAFAMNADWGIMIGYKFFMNFAEEGTNIVLGALGQTPIGGTASITAPDAVISNFFNTTTTGTAGSGLPDCTPTMLYTGQSCNLQNCTTLVSASGYPCVASQTSWQAGLPSCLSYWPGNWPATSGLPTANCNPPVCSDTLSAAGISCMTSLSGIPQFCLLILFVLASLLLFFMPVIVIFILILLIGYIGSFMRAMLNYLTSLVLISFLFIFAPFFLSFALFRTTMPLFEGWLKHLISFSLQMIIMFAFMAMLTLLPVFQFFASLLGLLKSYDYTFSVIPDLPIPGVSQAFSFPLHFCGICQYDVTAIGALVCHPHPLGAQTVAAAKVAAAKAGYMLSDDNNFWLTSLWNLIEDAEVAKYVLINVIALYALSKAMRDFLHKAPELAKHLGGVASAAALGGGGGSLSGPGVSYAGLQSITAAYYGMKNGLLMGGYRNRYSPGVDEKTGEKIWIHVGWRDRLRNGLLGMPDTDEYGRIMRRDDGTIVKKPNVGLLQGLTQGAYDQRTLAGRAHQNQLAKYDAVIGKLQSKGKLTVSEQATLRDMQRLRRDLEIKGAANFKTGLFEVREDKKRLAMSEEDLNKLKEQYKKALAEGAPKAQIKLLERQLRRALTPTKLLIHRSSMNTTDAGNETSARIQNWDQRHRERKMYGHYVKDKPANWYYGMKMPDTVYAVDEPQRMDRLMHDARNLLQSAQMSLSSSSMSPEAKQKLQGELDSAGMHIMNATSAGQLDGIIKNLNSLSRQIK